MRRLKTVVTVVLALLWLPVTAHCQLESLPGLGFLSCCGHAEAEKSPAHHEDDCAADGCAAVESELHLPDTSPEIPAKPALVAVDLAPTVPMAKLPVATASPPGFSDAPPELPRIWQFALRAAELPRAPSLP